MIGWIPQGHEGCFSYFLDLPIIVTYTQSFSSLFEDWINLYVSHDSFVKWQFWDFFALVQDFRPQVPSQYLNVKEKSFLSTVYLTAST